MAKHFAQLPSKEEHPGYFESVKSPLSLEDISRKIDRRTYNSFLALRKDVQLICANAKLYSGEGSAIDQDARKLIAEFDRDVRIMANIKHGSHKESSVSSKDVRPNDSEDVCPSSA